MHQRKEMANKLIEKHLSYQDYNKLIINLSNESTNNQQLMNIDTGYLSEKMAMKKNTEKTLKKLKN